MKNRMRSLSVVLMMSVALGFAGCGGGDDYYDYYADNDCTEAIPPAQTQDYGEICDGFYYGSCPTYFNNCIYDVCEPIPGSDPRTEICTLNCSSDSDCAFLGYTCTGGVCMP